MYQIIEANWSETDTLGRRDEPDYTCVVIDKSGIFISPLFKKYFLAKQFIQYLLKKTELESY